MLILLMCSPPGWSAIDREQTPRAGDTFQSVEASIREAKTGTRHEILDGGGDQNLAGTSKSSHASAHMDSEAPELVSHDFALSSVEARAQPDAERGSGVAYG